MNTLTAEGDRSGVETPSHTEKAKHKVEAARMRLETLISTWESTRNYEVAIDEVAECLHSAVLFLNGTDH